MQGHQELKHLWTHELLLTCVSWIAYPKRTKNCSIKKIYDKTPYVQGPVSDVGDI